jgi:hypothetical protein
MATSYIHHTGMMAQELLQRRRPKKHQAKVSHARCNADAHNYKLCHFPIMCGSTGPTGLLQLGLLATKGRGYHSKKRRKEKPRAQRGNFGEVKICLHFRLTVAVYHRLTLELSISQQHRTGPRGSHVEGYRRSQPARRV